MINVLEQEQIIREVTNVGNGAHIFVPKIWVGQKVIIIRPKLSLKEEILRILEDHLRNIIGIYLVGSYARKENEEDSDIDVLIISDKKIKIKEKGKYHITAVTLDGLKKTLENNPILIYPMLKEAVPILNEKILNELLSIDVKNKYGWYLEHTKSALDIVKSIIDIERERDLSLQKKASSSLIYTLIMRLRGLYLIECIQNDKRYTNKDFKRFVIKEGIDKDTFEEMYKIYRYVRDRKKAHHNIKFIGIKRLYYIVYDYMKRVY